MHCWEVWGSVVEECVERVVLVDDDVFFVLEKEIMRRRASGK